MTTPKTLALAAALALYGYAAPGPRAARRQSDEPEKVTPCRLKGDPARYNHRLVEVTGFISHGFEDFTLSDPDCPSWPPVWLKYGGTAASGTMYCCGVTSARARPKQLVVEKIPVPLVADGLLRRFDELLRRPPDSVNCRDEGDPQGAGACDLSVAAGAGRGGLYGRGQSPLVPLPLRERPEEGGLGNHSGLRIVVRVG